MWQAQERGHSITPSRNASKKSTVRPPRNVEESSHHLQSTSASNPQCVQQERRMVAGSIVGTAWCVGVQAVQRQANTSNRTRRSESTRCAAAHGSARRQAGIQRNGARRNWRSSQPTVERAARGRLGWGRGMRRQVLVREAWRCACAGCGVGVGSRWSIKMQKGGMVCIVIVHGNTMGVRGNLPATVVCVWWVATVSTTPPPPPDSVWSLGIWLHVCVCRCMAMSSQMQCRTHQ